MQFIKKIGPYSSGLIGCSILGTRVIKKALQLVGMFPLYKLIGFSGLGTRVIKKVLQLVGIFPLI